MSSVVIMLLVFICDFIRILEATEHLFKLPQSLEIKPLFSYGFQAENKWQPGEWRSCIQFTSSK